VTRLLDAHDRTGALVNLVASGLTGAAVYAATQVGAWPGRARA
jgi:hypothetical protein